MQYVNTLHCKDVFQIFDTCFLLWLSDTNCNWDDVSITLTFCLDIDMIEGLIYFLIITAKIWRQLIIN